MNGTQLKYGHLLPLNDDRNFAVDGIEICCDCGSSETIILSSAIYCRICRSFRLYLNRLNDRFRSTGTVLDLIKMNLKKPTKVVGIVTTTDLAEICSWDSDYKLRRICAQMLLRMKGLTH